MLGLKLDVMLISSFLPRLSCAATFPLVRYEQKAENRHEDLKQII